jgi:hypothetical protein
VSEVVKREGLEARLLTEATPQPDAKREALDREELRVLLDGSDDPVKIFMQLVQSTSADDRRLTAVLCSSFGRTLLRVRGLDPDIHAQLRKVAALTSARDASDDYRARSARALAKIGQLRQSTAASSSAPHMAGGRRA